MAAAGTPDVVVAAAYAARDGIGVGGAGGAAARFVLALQRYLGTTEGRDKVYRLVQYASKLLRGWVPPPASAATGATSMTAGGAVGGAPADKPFVAAAVDAAAPSSSPLVLLAQKALTLELLMSDSRKVFRLARGVNVVAKHVRQARQPQSQPGVRGAAAQELKRGREQQQQVEEEEEEHASAAKVLEALADAGLFGFFALDHAAWLYRAKLLTAEPERGALWMQRAGRCFLLANVASLLLKTLRGRRVLRQFVATALPLLMAVCRRRRRRRQQAGDDAAQRAGKLDGKQQQRARVRALATRTLADIVRHACDIVVGLNMSRPGRYSPALVGACGALSSLIQIVQLWPPPPATATAPAPAAQR